MESGNHYILHAHCIAILIRIQNMQSANSNVLSSVDGFPFAFNELCAHGVAFNVCAPIFPPCDARSIY